MIQYLHTINIIDDEGKVRSGYNNILYIYRRK